MASDWLDAELEQSARKRQTPAVELSLAHGGPYPVCSQRDRGPLQVDISTTGSLANGGRCRLKAVRRVATRYDQLVTNSLAAVCLASRYRQLLVMSQAMERCSSVR